MLGMLNCAEQYIVKNHKCINYNKHLTQEQNIYAYNHAQKPEAIELCIRTT